MTTLPLLPPGFTQLYVYDNLCIHSSLICTFREIFYEVCCSQKRMRKTEIGKKHELTWAQGQFIPFLLVNIFVNQCTPQSYIQATLNILLIQTNTWVCFFQHYNSNIS